jgi:hypothetical protein
MVDDISDFDKTLIDFFEDGDLSSAFSRITDIVNSPLPDVEHKEASAEKFAKLKLLLEEQARERVLEEQEEAYRKEDLLDEDGYVDLDLPHLRAYLHLPGKYWDMIARDIVGGDSLLKEEIALLKTEEGQLYMRGRLFKENKAQESFYNGSCLFKRHNRHRGNNGRY